jgi:hypothetical protein
MIRCATPCRQRTNAAGLVLNKIGNQLQGKVLDLGYVGNDMVKYVMNAVPDATKHFGLTEERVANMIRRQGASGSEHHGGSDPSGSSESGVSG